MVHRGNCKIKAKKGYDMYKNERKAKKNKNINTQKPEKNRQQNELQI